MVIPPEFKDIIESEDFDVKDADVLALVQAVSSGEGTDSVLSDRAILEAIKNGHIKIYPFDKDQLNNCSYDVRLGKWYYRQRTADDPISPDNIHEMWDGPHLMEVNSDTDLDIPHDCRYIILRPGETILTNTFDFIGAQHDITACMKAKSTTARMCISVCGDAGWGDIGYINRWCMQVRNNGIHEVVLVWGMKIAQIVFHKSSEPMSSYTEKGHYQSTDDLGELISDWEPESMMPKKKLSLPPEFTIGDPEAPDDTEVCEIPESVDSEST